MSIEKGECLIDLIPESLGKTKKCRTYPTLSAEKGRPVVMLRQDIIHAVTNGQVKTPKHIGLGVTIHHLTGSKEVMTEWGTALHMMMSKS